MSEQPRSTEPRSPGASTIARVLDLAADEPHPQPRRHHDSEQLRRAVDDRLRARWAAMVKRGIGWALSAGLGSGATAGGFMLTDDAQLHEQPVVVCDHDPQHRRDIRLALDYLAAIFGMLRNPGEGETVREPAAEPLPAPRFTNGPTP